MFKSQLLSKHPSLVRIFSELHPGVKVVTLGRQNKRNSSYVRLAHTSIFGLCFMSVCLMKSNCYSLKNSSLPEALSVL